MTQNETRPPEPQAAGTPTAATAGVPAAADIAAVVVLYQPTTAVPAAVASYQAQVATVIAVDNTERPDQDLVATLKAMGIDYLWLGGNRGIAAGLNAGCRRASDLGFSWALTMDQDSVATATMVRDLAACLHHPSAARILLVAPNWQQEGGLPVSREGCCVPTPDAITSGNLLRLAGFRALGGFREDFFIDRVDSEFCLRARRHGWLLMQRRDVVLVHHLGHLRRTGRLRPFFVTDHSPLRRYYMVRNLLEVRRRYGAEFPEYVVSERRYWIKEVPRIILGERQRRAKFSMMLQGWTDYRRRRFGKYEELHPTPKKARSAVWQARLWALAGPPRPAGRNHGGPAVSIVLVTYNRLRMLHPCLSSVLSNTGDVDYELIVWDNASTDGTAQYLDKLASEHAHLRVVHSPRNVGLNGVAHGMRLARGRYLVEMDDDVLEVPPGWLSQMVHAFDRVPRAGYLAANVVQDDLTNGAKPSADAYKTVDYGDGVVIEHGPAGGWCTMTSRAVMRRLGGFQEMPGRIFFGEDADYATRCRRHLYRVGIVRDVVVYHATGMAKNIEFGYGELCHAKYQEDEKVHHLGVGPPEQVAHPPVRQSGEAPQDPEPTT